MTELQDISTVRSEGNVAFKGGEYAKALTKYTKALELANNDKLFEDRHKLLSNRAATHMKLRQYKEA